MAGLTWGGISILSENRHTPLHKIVVACQYPKMKALQWGDGCVLYLEREYIHPPYQTSI